VQQQADLLCLLCRMVQVQLVLAQQLVAQQQQQGVVTLMVQVLGQQQRVQQQVPCQVLWFQHSTMATQQTCLQLLQRCSLHAWHHLAGVTPPMSMLLCLWRLLVRAPTPRVL
jgi:hypothetical protein